MRVIRRAVVVLLLIGASVSVFDTPVRADPGWEEAVRRKLFDDAHAGAHWGELVRRVLWGWAPRTPGDDFLEALRRAGWDRADAVAHWDEAVRRFLWDAAHATTTTTTTTVVPTVPAHWHTMFAASPWKNEWVGIANYEIAAAQPDGHPNLYGAYLSLSDVATIFLFPNAFQTQAILDYTVAHEVGHAYDFRYGRGVTDPLILAAPQYPEEHGIREAFADCYAQKRTPRPIVPPGVLLGYWTCPTPIVAVTP